MSETYGTIQDRPSQVNKLGITRSNLNQTPQGHVRGGKKCHFE